MSSASVSPGKEECRPAYRPDIDGLRAVAILSVVVYHAFPAALQGGFVGVDVFFVISGFLISSIIFGGLRRNEFSFIAFYAHRVRRIFPALFLVLAASYVVGWFSLLPEEFKSLGKHIAAGAAFGQNIVLWKESGYFDTASELKPLLHLWSLAIEEQFYLIYPLAIWAAWKTRAGLVGLIVLAGVLSFGWNVHDISSDATGTFFLTHTRIWELLAGAAVAHVRMFGGVPRLAERLGSPVAPAAGIASGTSDEGGEPTARHAISIAGVLLIVASCTGLSRDLLFPGWWALGPVLGSCLVILAGPDAWANRVLLARKPVVFIGLISYPLYLWHWPLLSFAHIMASAVPSAGIRMAALASSFVLGWLTYRLWERPIRFGRKTWARTAALCAAMGLTGFVGYNTFERDGLIFRHTLLAQDRPEFAWGENLSNALCRQSYPAFKQAFCMLAKPEAPTVLILGDSHSNHLYPGLADITRTSRENVMNLADGACLPFFDVASFESGQRDVCMDSTNGALSFGLETGSVKTIILSARGPLYLYGSGYSEIPNERGHHRTIALNPDRGMVDARQVFTSAMRATLQRLVASGKQIVFVIDVPELNFEPKWCAGSLPLSFDGGVRKVCAIPRSEYERRAGEYRRLALSVLGEFPSVSVFDPVAYLCDENWCWAEKEGKLLYRDANHLSLEGSRHLAERLVKTIQLDSSQGHANNKPVRLSRD